MTARKILEMIESVDPSDADSMDEIDARVWCYANMGLYSKLSPIEFIEYGPRPQRTVHEDDLPEFFHDVNDGFHIVGLTFKYQHNAIFFERFVTISDKYTRRRTELKKVRPKGWDNITVSIYGGVATAYISNGMIKKESPELPTEELAELHAIIQAIEHDRTAK